MSQAARCSGTKLGSCSARAEWDVISSYTPDNALRGPEYDSTCDQHLADTVRWVMSWHRDTAVSVEPHAYSDIPVSTVAS